MTALFVQNRTAFATLALFGQLLCLTSCSPLQGYPGPQLPNEKVAIFKHPGSWWDTDEELQRISMDGIAFDTDGIAVLPGEHEIDAYVEHLLGKHDCVPEQQIDDSGYQSCVWRQNEARRKGRSWSYCSISDYTSTTYHCIAEIRDSDCHFKVKAEPGKRYEIRFGNHSTPVAEAAVYEKASNLRVGSGACTAVRSHSERRDFSSL